MVATNDLFLLLAISDNLTPEANIWELTLSNEIDS